MALSVKIKEREELRARKIGYLILSIILIILMTILSIIERDRLKEYNKQNCAVYGYEEDCKTRLKR